MPLHAAEQVSLPVFECAKERSSTLKPNELTGHGAGCVSAEVNEAVPILRPSHFQAMTEAKSYTDDSSFSPVETSGLR